MDENIFSIKAVIAKCERENRKLNINKSEHFNNNLKRRALLAKKLEKESEIVRAESIRILKELERIN